MTANPLFADRFSVHSEISRGGQGIVYRATEVRLERVLALKLIAEVYVHDQVFRERFEREAKLAASLDHPSIIKVFAFDLEPQPYIAMQYISGGDLTPLVAGERRDPRTALHVLRHVAEALDFAHDRGVVHRDIKPANILLDAEVASDGMPHAYVTDFGISVAIAQSRVTPAGIIVGSPSFMAPEQFRGDEIDGRADLYSLACTAYLALTGKMPFVRDRSEALMYAHLHERASAPSAIDPTLGQAVDASFDRALAKEPGDRHPTCREFIADLQAAHVGSGVQPGDDDWRFKTTVPDARVREMRTRPHPGPLPDEGVEHRARLRPEPPNGPSAPKPVDRATPIQASPDQDVDKALDPFPEAPVPSPAGDNVADDVEASDRPQPGASPAGAGSTPVRQDELMAPTPLHVDSPRIAPDVDQPPHEPPKRNRRGSSKEHVASPNRDVEPRPRLPLQSRPETPSRRSKPPPARQPSSNSHYDRDDRARTGGSRVQPSVIAIIGSLVVLIIVIFVVVRLRNSPGSDSPAGSDGASGGGSLGTTTTIAGIAGANLITVGFGPAKSSRDGTKWEPILGNGDAPFTAIPEGGGAAVAGSAALLWANATPTASQRVTTWYSADSVKFVEGALPNASVRTAATDGSMWVATGWQFTDGRPPVASAGLFTSADGVHWSGPTSRLPITDGRTFTVSTPGSIIYDSKNHRWVFFSTVDPSGSDKTTVQVALWSTDLRTWSAALSPLLEATFDGTRWVGLGERRRQGNDIVWDVNSSTDLTNWDVAGSLSITGEENALVGSLRYWDGWYYSDHNQQMLRSRDLRTWDESASGVKIGYLATRPVG